jgi:hypothetical protein
MDYDLVQAKNGSPSAEKPLLHAPPRTRPDGAKTVVRLMERLLLVALSVTVRTAAVKHKFAGSVSIQSLVVRVVIASPPSRPLSLPLTLESGRTGLRAGRSEAGRDAGTTPGSESGVTDDRQSRVPRGTTPLMRLHWCHGRAVRLVRGRTNSVGFKSSQRQSLPARPNRQSGAALLPATEMM